MTAPFSPHPPRIVWLICLGFVAVAVAMPFARRDDLLGWLSLSVVLAFAVILWALLAMDALILDEDVTVSTPRKHVAFPKSRSERFKIVQLIGDLAGSCPEVQHEIERRRVKLRCHFAIWFPISLLTAALLVLPIIAVPEPQRLNVFWILAGIAYGLAWHWLLWKFAYSVTCFFGARKLQSILLQELKPGRTIR